MSASSISRRPGWVSYLLSCQLRLQDLNCLFDLSVTAFHEIRRRVVDVHIGRDAVIFHVLAIRQPDTAARGANRRAVEESVRSGADNRAIGGHANDLA